MPMSLEDEIKKLIAESKPIYLDKTGAIIKGDNTQSTVNPEIGEPVTDLREEEIKRQNDKDGTIEIDSQGFVKKGDTSSEVPVKPTSGEPATHLKPTRWC